MKVTFLGGLACGAVLVMLAGRFFVYLRASGTNRETVMAASAVTSALVAISTLIAVWV